MAKQRIQYLQGHLNIEVVLLDELGDGRKHIVIGLREHC